MFSDWRQRPPPPMSRPVVSFLVALLLALGAATLGRADVAAAAQGTSVCTKPNPRPTYQDVRYGQVGAAKLNLDVYEPGTRHGPSPALLILHVAGWKSGCKGEAAYEGARSAAEGFVAFVIDVRLACDPLNPPVDVDDKLLCGYHATVPVDDVHTAVRWIRQNSGTYGVDPRQVAALGFSSGGNLVLMAAATGIRGDTAPDVVAGWSPLSELGYLLDGTVTCTESSNPDDCTSAVTNYVGCPLLSCPSFWVAASPFTFATTGDPPVFVANSSKELVPLEDATDYQLRLRSVGVPMQLCVVDGAGHARQIEDSKCRDSGLTVWNETVSFIKDHLA